MAQRPKKEKPEVVAVESKAMAPAVIAQPKSLVLEGDPESQLAFAQKAANALMKVVRPVEIQGKPYLQFGGWQTLARFFGATVAIEWTQPLVDAKNYLLGYEARAIVYQNGQIISSAEASCMKTEKRWAKAEEYAVTSMAQTRASAKALRNAFGWVAELAEDPKTGQRLQSTPAEEMTYDRSTVPDDAHVSTTGADELAYYNMPNENHTSPPPSGGAELICSDTGKPISEAEYGYSMKFYGRPLSRAAQKNHNRIK